MKSALVLEKSWLEGLHNEYLPTADSFPEEIRESISYASRKVGNPLLPLLVKWTLEPAGIPQTSIVPLSYSVHLLEVSSSILDGISLGKSNPPDRRLTTLINRYGEALCILCVDAMVTMSFQLLTELPPNEFMELSDLLVQRFGADGVLGKKTDASGDWKGDMLVVSLEASVMMGGFDRALKRKLLDYARRLSRLYRELESLTGEPPCREILINSGSISGLKKRGCFSSAHRIVREVMETTADLGSACDDFFSLSEEINEAFAWYEKSLSRLEKKEKAASAENGIC